jgi:FMN phosphatase YigB (HAD superfamily)
MLPVAITSGGGFQGAAFLRCLVGQPGIKTVLLDCYADNVNRYWADSFHIVPPVKDEEDFIAAVAGIIRSEGVRAVFPSSDYELDVLARNRDRLATAGALVAASPPHLLRVLRDKKALYAALKDLSFPVVPMVDLSDGDIPFPLLGKPLSGWGGRGMRLLRTAADLGASDRASLMCDYVWQPFFEDFSEYSADFAIDFEGRISPAVLRKRVRVSGGFAVIADSHESARIAASLAGFARLMAERGGRGVFNVQVIEPEAGDFFYSDVNPRIGTSSVFSLGAGINLPLFVCRSIEPGVGRDVQAVSRPLRMLRRLEERYINRLDPGDVAGVVFDLDDTLIDHKSWILAKSELTWAQLSHRLPDRHTFMRIVLRFVEEGPRNLLLDAVIKALNLPPELREPLIETYRKAMPGSVHSYSDVAPCLAALKAAGLRLALLTDNPQPGQRQKLSLFPYTSMFDAIVFSREHGGEKPAPKAFVRAADELCLDRARLMMVGDNLHRDIAGALRCGYGWAAWMKRQSSFFGFNFDLFAQYCPAEAQRTLRLETMNELVYALSA